MKCSELYRILIIMGALWFLKKDHILNSGIRLKVIRLFFPIMEAKRLEKDWKGKF